MLNKFQPAMAEEGYNEIEIDFAEEIKEGEIRELIVGAGEEDKVIVTRYEGKLRCIGNYCPHFNLPLAKSFIADDKIVCQFHNAAFSILTGAPENAPALDGIPIFEIIENEGKYFAKVPTVLPKKQPMPMCTRDPSDTRKFVIIGGGAAGLSAAETLRQSNFGGEIIVISRESIVPYDRTLLTKNTLGLDATKVVLRSQDFLSTYGIDYKLNS
jgi:apoptosis-inducing factor 3